MKWVATARWVKDRYYIDIMDAEGWKIRHPFYPFPLESYDKESAYNKAKRSVDRANEDTGYNIEPLFLVE